MLGISMLAKAQELDELPHIFYHTQGYTIKWIEQAQLHELHDTDQRAAKKIKSLSKRFRIPLQAALQEQQRSASPGLEEYPGVSKFIAISDLHGQQGLFVELLRAHHIIDKNHNWSFGQGHLVIVGDILDRGDQVTEALWLVYQLEQQALQAGGRLHYVIGNHELMVFDNDLRYINKKYKQVASLMGTQYSKLFAAETFFGKWMKAKPVMISINDVLFTHGGISEEFIHRGLTQVQTNTLFVDSIFTQPRAKYRENETLNFLSRSNGPLWYRGYFNDQTFDIHTLNWILKGLKKNRIIVGHTSHPTIVSLFENKVFGVDSSIKNGQSGEVLIYENGQYFRGLKDGSRQNF